MIANVDPGKLLFLSVAFDDGSMEAFENVDDAVAHASDVVEHGGSERGIFVAVPRARVHRSVRVDPLEPPAVPEPMPVLINSAPDASARHKDWVGAQVLTQPGGGDHSSEAHEADRPSAEKAISRWTALKTAGIWG